MCNHHPNRHSTSLVCSILVCICATLIPGNAVAIPLVGKTLQTTQSSVPADSLPGKVSQAKDSKETKEKEAFSKVGTIEIPKYFKTAMKYETTDCLKLVKRCFGIDYGVPVGSLYVVGQSSSLLGLESWGIKQYSKQPTPKALKSIYFAGLSSKADELFAVEVYGFEPTPTKITYRWFRSDPGSGDWKLIDGATEDSYRLGRRDEGKRIRVEATVYNGTSTKTVSRVLTDDWVMSIDYPAYRQYVAVETEGPAIAAAVGTVAHAFSIALRNTEFNNDKADSGYPRRDFEDYILEGSPLDSIFLAKSWIDQLPSWGKWQYLDQKGLTWHLGYRMTNDSGITDMTVNGKNATVTYSEEYFIKPNFSYTSDYPSCYETVERQYSLTKKDNKWWVTNMKMIDSHPKVGDRLSVSHVKCGEILNLIPSFTLCTEFEPRDSNGKPISGLSGADCRDLALEWRWATKN